MCDYNSKFKDANNRQILCADIIDNIGWYFHPYLHVSPQSTPEKYRIRHDRPSMSPSQGPKYNHFYSPTKSLSLMFPTSTSHWLANSTPSSWVLSKLNSIIKCQMQHH